MSRTAAIIALVCALVGLWAASEAAYVHYRMLHDPTYVSFCEVSATVSCGQVLSSRFATVRGIPVAIFGAMWFGTALLLSLAGLTARPSVRDSVPGYLFAGSTLALAMILYLGYASFVLLKLVCLLCLTTYAAVIGLFLVSGAATSVSMMSLPRRATSDLRVLATSPLALCLTLLLAGSSPTPGAARLVMKDSPRNPQCNTDLKQMLHPGACDAAVAVRLARAHNRGAEMEEWLYTHQQGMTPETVRQAAREVGLVTDFDEKYAATIELVKGDIALARTLRVGQTPTFFVNGVKIEGAMAPQFFDQAIAYELQRANAK